ncbi:uncharacterized protein LOC126323270 [Schistocerca gregaria]|uniref:uncharacterized protein LOC126323270 n=1 Tax=Schistocerca gregaria TaxID=7010 RepID=UPI00211DFAE3|nr:uncharacterized protein LOC126323270 [Schistocerca gregaria]
MSRQDAANRELSEFSMAGYLKTLVKNDALKWKTRWFVLNSAEYKLHCHKNKGQQESEYCIDLRQVTVVYRDKGPGNEFVIETLPSGQKFFERAYIMKAASSSQVELWVLAITSVLEWREESQCMWTPKNLGKRTSKRMAALCKTELTCQLNEKENGRENLTGEDTDVAGAFQRVKSMGEERGESEFLTCQKSKQVSSIYTRAVEERRFSDERGQGLDSDGLVVRSKEGIGRGVEEEVNVSEYYSAMSVEVTQTADESIQRSAVFESSLTSLLGECEGGSTDRSKSTSSILASRCGISLIEDARQRHIESSMIIRDADRSHWDEGEESVSDLEGFAKGSRTAQEGKATNMWGEEVSIVYPDQFCEIIEELYKSPDYIDREVHLSLGKNVIALKRGTWIIEKEGDRSWGGTEEQGRLTWHLPGYVVVAYTPPGEWFVRMRGSTPADEIKWNLVDIVDALHNSELNHQEQSIIYHLYESVSSFVDKFRFLEKAIFIPEEEKAEALDDFLDLNLGLYIRVRFCTSIASVLARGLKRRSLFKKYHIWDFILNMGTDAKGAGKEHLLLSRTVQTINRDTQIGDENSKFREFIVAALNTGRLFEWMCELLKEKSKIQTFYEAKALVLVCPNMIVNAMAPLGSLPFRLSHEKDFRDMVIKHKQH